MKKGDKKKYQFSEIVAIEVGLEEAIMFSNIYYWVNFNKRNEDEYNFHDGKYWTFNSIVDFVKQYPFWTPSIIRRIFKNLKLAGYIETGVFNKFGYDKTKWYTITDKGWKVMESTDGSDRNDNWTIGN